MKHEARNISNEVIVDLLVVQVPQPESGYPRVDT